MNIKNQIMIAVAAISFGAFPLSASAIVGFPPPEVKEVKIYANELYRIGPDVIILEEKGCKIVLLDNGGYHITCEDKKAKKNLKAGKCGSMKCPLHPPHTSSSGKPGHLKVRIPAH